MHDIDECINETDPKMLSPCDRENICNGNYYVVRDCVCRVVMKCKCFHLMERMEYIVYIH